MPWHIVKMKLQHTDFLAKLRLGHCPIFWPFSVSLSALLGFNIFYRFQGVNEAQQFSLTSDSTSHIFLVSLPTWQSIKCPSGCAECNAFCFIIVQFAICAKHLFRCIYLERSRDAESITAFGYVLHACTLF